MRKYLQLEAAALLFWVGLIITVAAPSFFISCVGLLVAWVSSRAGDRLLTPRSHE